jgi:hypothetical protein
MLNLSSRTNPINVIPKRSAVSMARLLGADTAQTRGIPATAAF